MTPSSGPIEPASAFSALARLLDGDASSHWDPRRVWLSSFREEDGAARIECHALDYEDVAELLRRLAASATFHDVVLQAGEREASAHRVTATITARVDARRRLVLQTAEEAKPYLAGASRNPFNDRSGEIAGTAPSTSLAEQTPVERLRLIAIVTAHDDASPRAMLMDDAGRGWVASIGSIVGRSDDPRSSSSGACRWRVMRIQGASVTLGRDDPKACTASPAESVLHLK